MCSSVHRLYFSKINYTSSTHLQRIHRNKALPAISDSVVESFLSPAGAASISGPPFSAGPFEFSAQFFELFSFAPQSSTSFPPVSTPSMMFLGVPFLLLNPGVSGNCLFFQLVRCSASNVPTHSLEDAEQKGCGRTLIDQKNERQLAVPACFTFKLRNVKSSRTIFECRILNPLFFLILFCLFVSLMLFLSLHNV